jgi:very-short-patch-repair endonuclease
MRWDLVDHVARQQHGLVTSTQLRDLGCSPKAARWATAQGRLEAVRTGVFRTAGAPLSRDQAWLAAVLAARGDPVLSHASAATARGLVSFPDPPIIDLLVEGPSRPRLEGVQAHRTDRLPRQDRTLLRGIPITTAERTFVDGCGLLSVRSLGRSVDDALRRRLVTRSALVRTAATVPLSGRRRSRPIREVLAERVEGYDPGGSAAELDVMAVLRRRRVAPLPAQQYRVTVEGRSYRIDYAWPEVKHAIEYLGATWHGTPSAVHDDSRRTSDLQRYGWTVWPITLFTTEIELMAIVEVVLTDLSDISALSVAFGRGVAP